MELDEQKIQARIDELETLLHVPPQGRIGGIWEKPLYDELTFLDRLLQYKKTD